MAVMAYIIRADHPHTHTQISPHQWEVIVHFLWLLNSHENIDTCANPLEREELLNV